MTHEEHNELVEDYVRHVVGDVIKGGGGFADVMVIMESVLTGTMVLLCRQFTIRPDIVSGLVESAMHRATERFIEINRAT